MLLGHELSDKEYESTKCRMIRSPKAQEKDDETGTIYNLSFYIRLAPYHRQEDVGGIVYQSECVLDRSDEEWRST